ncbi:OLC1v1035915C1 [Oldenlandia corymbosa var. corymbosa]|uniref:OLC1v1035915C1 n=1 Tax=Oldenlandia corymbosa var. corymbosa TaxID=529605 RepID=A0AAV1CVH6_OLDCO|nr:OLC1v1035915C1 [Oldenlandia corymbosa var. corymbosa]
MSSVRTIDLYRIFERLDKNGDGLVSLEELMWLLHSIGVQTSLEELKLLVFDSNGDGFISSEELKNALCRLGLLDERSCGKDYCTSVINVYDTNCDGKLDFEEFKNMMLV